MLISTAIVVMAVVGALPGEQAYLSGDDHMRVGKYAAALASFRECAAQGGPLSPYAQARLGQCRARGGDVPGGIDVYEALLDAYPKGPWVRMAQTELAALYYRNGQAEAASALMGKALDTPIQPSWLKRYRWDLAEYLEKAPATRDDGFDLVVQLMDETRLRAERREGAHRLARATQARHLLAAAEGYLRLDEFDEAGEVLLAATPLANEGDREIQAQFQFLYGRLLCGTKREEAGRMALAQAVEVSADPALKGRALAYLARTLVRAGLEEQASEAYKRLVRDYPGTEDTGYALWWRAGRQVEAKKNASAIATYRLLAETCPNYYRADDALFEAADLHRQAGRNTEALALYADLMARFPDGNQRGHAGLASGQLRESRGDKTGAAEDYQRAFKDNWGDFYAHRASERYYALTGATPHPQALRVAGGHSYVRPIPTGITAPDDRPGPDLTETNWYRRMNLFAAHGLEEAEWEALHVMERVCGTDHESLIYHLMADAGLYASAAQVMAQRGWNPKTPEEEARYLRIRFPRAYWDQVASIARTAGVDPLLMLAIGRQESLFQARIGSSAGARGVMQLMPSTAKWLADVDDAIGAHHAAHLDHPGNSLQMGATYLSRMIRRSDGNLVYALASYNAGPGNLDKWRSRYSGYELDRFVEAIPFSETRDYVKRVLGNYAAYHSIYGSPNVARLPLETDREKAG